MAFPSKATHQQTRAHNAAVVLRALYEYGPISRADVARLSGLTRTTVGDLVAGLLGEGLAREVGRGPSTGGKAPILVELVDGARHVIGVDLGEHIFRAAIVDLRGQVQLVVERPVTGLHGDAALAVVYELIDALAETARETLLGIGVGTPGIVDATTGTIRWAASLKWQDLPLGDLLRDRYGVPTRIANDSRAAALAIQLFGARRSGNLVAIKVGRGIGAGIVLGGELFHGDGFAAGEIGHVVVEEDGAECRCGRFGCLETVASSRAIEQRASERWTSGSKDSNAANAAKDSNASNASNAAKDANAANASGPSLDDVRVALEAGDENARQIVVAAGRYLGQAIAGVIGLLDVEYVALHGSVTQLGVPWLDAVRDEARRRSLALAGRNIAIEIAPPIGDLVVMGASALLLNAELGLAVAR
jgi:N-acetylglucosamine repressor